jgi:hypothetical protein
MTIVIEWHETKNLLAHALAERPEAEGNYPLHFQHLKIKELYCLGRILRAMDRSTKSIPPERLFVQHLQEFLSLWMMLQDIEIQEGLYLME